MSYLLEREEVNGGGCRPELDISGEEMASGIIAAATHSPHPPVPAFQPLYRWDGKELHQINTPTPEQVAAKREQRQAVDEDTDDASDEQLSLFGAA